MKAVPEVLFVCVHNAGTRDEADRRVRALLTELLRSA